MSEAVSELLRVLARASRGRGYRRTGPMIGAPRVPGGAPAAPTQAYAPPAESAIPPPSPAPSAPQPQAEQPLAKLLSAVGDEEGLRAKLRHELNTMKRKKTNEEITREIRTPDARDYMEYQAARVNAGEEGVVYQGVGSETDLSDNEERQRRRELFETRARLGSPAMKYGADVRRIGAAGADINRSERDAAAARERELAEVDAAHQRSLEIARTPNERAETAARSRVDVATVGADARRDVAQRNNAVRLKVSEAQQAMAEKNYDLALRKLGEARALSEREDYESDREFGLRAAPETTFREKVFNEQGKFTGERTTKRKEIASLKMPGSITDTLSGGGAEAAQESPFSPEEEASFLQRAPELQMQDIAFFRSLGTPEDDAKAMHLESLLKR